MQGEGKTSKKNTFVLPYGDTVVKVSGNFDSGNLNSASVSLEEDQIQLSFGRDKDVNPSSKCWFYFSVQASSYLPAVKLYLMKVNTLSVVSKIYDLYRPVVRVEGEKWQRYDTPIDFERTAQEDVNFKLKLEIPESRKVYVALCYPWSVQENNLYLEELQRRLATRQDIYFNKQTLILSPEGRQIHLLAISSSEVSRCPPEKYHEHLFPFKEYEKHFNEIHKPLILITSRVHPGEVGSSHALKGVIDFITSEDIEAVKILRQFYFLIVPILNPDGVSNGNNRMDALGQNLNRFYHLPDMYLQPSCFAIKTLIEDTKRDIYAFFDLHGHANKKSCFLFGNSINNTRMQIESVLFAKYLSSICEYIEFKSCNFSRRQMSSKDKNQDLSKQGCARVVVHRWTNSPYCYTLETGLFKNVKVDEKGITRYGQKFYTPEIYHEVGAKMILSLFRILSKSKEIEEMRKGVSEYVIRLEKANNRKEKQLKTEGNIKGVKLEGKPADRIEEKPEDKSEQERKFQGNSQQKLSGKSQSKLLGKSQGKLEGKSQGRLEGKVQGKLSGKSQGKQQVKSSKKSDRKNSMKEPQQDQKSKKSGKQNEPKAEKSKQIQMILQKNKNYLLSCNEEDEDE